MLNASLKKCFFILDQLEDTYTSNLNPRKSKKMETEWQQSFLGFETICGRSRTSQKNHSVQTKDVPKATEFEDVKLTTLLEETCCGAKAQRFKN